MSLFRVLVATVVVAAPTLGAAVEPATSAAYRSPGTRRMAERLEKVIRGSDPMDNPFLSHRRAEALNRSLQPLITAPPTVANLDQLYRTQSKYAGELLNAGQSQQAIAQFQQIEQFLIRNQAYDEKPRSRLRTALATAYLRWGEQENCLAHHNSDSCLFPIRDLGQHVDLRGSRGAVAVLSEQLREFPNDLRARWLINIAYMTLGEYPGRVPPGWLIRPSTFTSEAEIKPFSEVAAEAGLDTDGLAGGVILDDFDGDGNLDLVTSSMGVEDQLRFFRNDGTGAWKDSTQESGLLGEVGGLNLVSCDYNNDGRLDIFVLRGGWMGRAGHYPNSLLRNNGDGTFDDVTEEAGLLSFHPTQTATWFDFNNDGWLDVFTGNETATGDQAQPCELHRNNGDGTFTNVASDSGVALVGFFKAVASGDYNNDGRPDLYLSWRGHDNILLRNDGPKDPEQAARSAWKFTDVAREAGVTQPSYSFPAWFFDYDNDGWLDLFVCDFGVNNVGDIAADYLGLPTRAERPRLYRNNHDGTFADVTRAAHLFKVLLGMGSNYGDLDNDGFLDFYIGTGDPDLSTVIPNRMFRNAEGKFFQDVTTSGGFGHLQKGHGIAFGDIDNDGDQDVYEVMGGAYEGDNYRNALFENPGQGNHWITLKLEGVKSNRAAIGARIHVVLNTGNGERHVFRTVGSGGSFGCAPLRAEIGLGQARSIQAIEITWPISGQVQILKTIAMDRFYKVREGESNAMPWELKGFEISKADAHTRRSGQHSH